MDAFFNGFYKAANEDKTSKKPSLLRQVGAGALGTVGGVVAGANAGNQLSRLSANKKNISNYEKMLAQMKGTKAGAGAGALLGAYSGYKLLGGHTKKEKK